LQQVGLSAQVFNDYSDSVKRGVVVGQLPAAGASAPSGAEAILIVSSGPSPAPPTTTVVLPDVVGKTEQEAFAVAGGIVASGRARICRDASRHRDEPAARARSLATTPTEAAVGRSGQRARLYLLSSHRAFFFPGGSMAPDVTE
jgi:hypothetical protein